MIYVFGHKNPDTDSVTSAIALSNLKNKMGISTIPCVLGNINKETKYILDFFEIEYPRYIDDIKTQIKDLNYDTIEGINPNHSILYAYKIMERDNLRVLPIVDDNNNLLGIVTMKGIAMGLIKGDYHYLKTELNNIVSDLGGEILYSNNEVIEGKISVISYYRNTIQKNEILNENSIVIVGDRYDIIDYSIECGVKLIIITGGEKIPEKYIEKAKYKKINMVIVNSDTYTTSKLINQCNYLNSIMKTKDIVKFSENEYLEDIKEELINNKYSYYPVVTENNKFLGFISRRHILKPNRKKVILVDHNEYSQSINGLREAQILEIVDHHKIGDISTMDPISFRNVPVGSTCTIVYNMFKEYNIDIENKIAGILLSGIISDTLFLKSPTTTEADKKALTELNLKLNLDLDKYVMKMFKAGTSLEGQSIEEIIFKDFKEFNIQGYKVGIGQVFTLDIEDILNRKDSFLEYINDIHNNKGYFITILVITDIIKNGSYILYKSNDDSIINNAFEKKCSQFMFIKDIVSRKKQIIPKLMESMNQL